MDILIEVVALVIVGLPTAVWFTIGAVRADHRRDREPRAPEPRYCEVESVRRPHVLGVAWARETTFIE